MAERRKRRLEKAGYFESLESLKRSFDKRIRQEANQPVNRSENQTTSTAFPRNFVAPVVTKDDSSDPLVNVGSGVESSISVALEDSEEEEEQRESSETRPQTNIVIDEEPLPIEEQFPAHNELPQNHSNFEIEDRKRRDERQKENRIWWENLRKGFSDGPNTESFSADNSPVFGDATHSKKTILKKFIDHVIDTNMNDTEMKKNWNLINECMRTSKGTPFQKGIANSQFP